jgi:carboxyl-terminal processing protease
LRTVVLRSAQITKVPVQNVQTLQTATGKVGYLLFNDHVATSEVQLMNAISQLKADGVQDLVLDIRYNGGGLLDIASELAYMVAGPARTTGAVFERLQFNRKNPFQLTDADTVTPFHPASLGFSARAGQALPQLGLSRVTVLTGGGTCSASESIINGLRGVNVQVNAIGNTTCGKPYGFIPRDNCGTTYFAIQFKGVNNQDFGDYADGMAPTCSVADDFSRPLGDPAEGRLAAALSYRVTGICPPAPTTARQVTVLPSDGEPLLSGKSLARTSRLLRAGTIEHR